MPAAKRKPSRSGSRLSKTKGSSRQAQARLLRVIGHPVRLMILETLSRRSCCVKDLNALVSSVSQPYLSQHMAALRRAKLVDCHSCGTLRCYYVLQPSLVRGLLRLLSRNHAVVSRERSHVVHEAMPAARGRKGGASSSRRGKDRSMSSSRP